MAAFLFRRLWHSVLVLWAMSLLVFAGVYAIGNPVDILLGPQADQADLARAVAALGLDRPLWQQYLIFLRQALSGNLGQSFVYNMPAIQLILERMPATLELAFAAAALAIALGIPLGLWAGVASDAAPGKLIMAASTLGFSLPTFWVGLLLIMGFAVELGWLPAGGRGPTTTLFGIPVSITSWEGLKHLVLPAANLALFKLALIIRLVRAGAREALLQDYVRYARAKGISEARILGVHVLKNILLPLVTVIGIEFGSLVAFAIVTESVFAWPGMGKLIVDSIGVLDRPVIVAYLLVVVALFMLINLLVDVAYTLLDPRVRDAHGRG